MGLLDQYLSDTDMQSPQNQQMSAIAAALLQAGGPSLRPISFGQALGGALNAGNQAYQSAQDRALMRQMKDEDLKLKQLQDLRAQTTFNRQEDWYKRINGNGQPTGQTTQQSIQQPLKLGMDSSGNMGFQSQPNIQAPQPQGQSNQDPNQTWLDSMSLADLALGKMTGIDTDAAMKAKQFLLTGIKRENNTTYIDPNTGKPTYYADPTKGLDYDPATKTVRALPGFNEANAATKGTETAAVEAAKAANDLVTLNLPSGPVQVTRAQALQMAQGMQQPQQNQQGQFASQPQGQQQPMQGLPQPMNATQAELNQRSTQLRANQPQMDNDRLTILQQELAKETDPNNRMMLQREIARVGGQTPQGMQQPQAAPQQQFAPQQQAFNQPRFGIPLQSEAQKAEELANVKLRTEPGITQQVGAVSGKQGTLNTSNDNWIKQRYNPALEAGDKAKDVAASLDTLKNVNFKTGWGSDAKITAANVLTGLGLAPKLAEFYASNGQVFQNEAMKQLVSAFEGQKGTQTEGDAKRVQQTFMQLSNTPYANQYIADLARAKANRDSRKAAFYQEAYPIALQSGDLTEVDRRWMKLQGSIWDDPVLQKYKGAK